MSHSETQELEALLNADDRVGWRGNTNAWVRRAQRWILSCADVTALSRLAEVVDDWRLLRRPAVACLVPLHRERLFNPVWNDVRHVLVRSTAGVGDAERDVWIGCLVYYLHPDRPRTCLSARADDQDWVASR